MEDLHSSGTVPLTQEQIDEQALKESMMSAAPGYAAGAYQESVQQDLGTNYKSSVLTTYLSRIIQRGMMERAPLQADLEQQGYSPLVAGAMSLGAYLGYTADTPNYDKAAMAAKLTEGVPVDQWGDVLEHNDLAAAERQRARILMLEERTSRLSAQMGTGSTLAYVAGGFIDVDLPLIVFSGGAVGAEKLAVATARGAKALGLADGAAARLAGAAQGALGGAQGAGLAAGGEALFSDKPDLNKVVDAVIAGATTGAVLGIASKPAEAVRTVQLRRINRDRWAEISDQARASGKPPSANPPY